MRHIVASGTRTTLLNLVWFQLCWLVAVIGRDAWLGLLFLLLMFHLCWPAQGKRDWPVVGCCGVIGILTDGALTQLGLFSFSPAPDFLIPFWLAGLWLAFAGTLSYGLKWLQDKPFLAALLGAIFGPLSYFAGMQLGAVAFDHNLTFTLMILALLWALLMPLFGWITARLMEPTYEKA